MLPDRVSNPGPLTYESGALPIALRGPAYICICIVKHQFQESFKSDTVGLSSSLSMKLKISWFCRVITSIIERK